MLFDASLDFRSFPSTHWTHIDQAAGSDTTTGLSALEVLLKRYYPALRTHLIYIKRIPVDRVDDILQDFVRSRLLEKRLITQAERSRGSFRAFILKSLDNFTVSEFRRESAAKRSPGPAIPIDECREPPHCHHAASDIFDIAWAREVIKESLSRMQESCRMSDRTELWGIFEARVMKPAIEGRKPVPYDELVRQYDIPSPAKASNLLVTAKRLYVKALHSVVSEYVADSSEIGSEINALHTILAGATRSPFQNTV